MKKYNEDELFERRLQRAADRVRLMMKYETDADKKKDLELLLSDIVSGRYNAEEHLKTAAKTWGGKYGFLPSGVIDYLDDDFDERFSFDELDKKQSE